MKNIILLIFFLNFPFLIFSDFYFSSRYNLFYNKISGEGKFQSFLSEGYKYIAQVQLFAGEKLGEINYDLNLSGTSTDDKKISYENYMLDNLILNVNFNNLNLSFGDVFNYISQYTLNMPVKGILFKYQNELFEINSSYGLSVPSWNSIYGNREIRTLKRYVTAGKLKIKLSDSLWFASNVSLLNDDEKTRINDYEQIYDNKLYSGEIEINPFEGVSLYSEYAYSKTKNIPFSNHPEKFMEDYAYKIRLILDGEPIWSTHEYEKIMADFISIAGSAIPDREKVNTRWKIKITEDIWLKAGFLWFRDNIENTKELRTDTINPDIGLTFKNWFGNKNFILNINYRYNKKYNKIYSGLSNLVGVDYSDRILILDNNLGISYSDERVDNIFRKYNLNWNTSTSFRQNFDVFAIKPEFKLNGFFSLNKENDKNSNGFDTKGDFTVEVINLGLNLTGGYGYGYNRTENNDSMTKKIYEGVLYFTPVSTYNINLRYVKNEYDFVDTINEINRDYTEDTYNINVEISF